MRRRIAATDDPTRGTSRVGPPPARGCSARVARRRSRACGGAGGRRPLPPLDLDEEVAVDRWRGLVLRVRQRRGEAVHRLVVQAPQAVEDVLRGRLCPHRGRRPGEHLTGRPPEGRRSGGAETRGGLVAGLVELRTGGGVAPHEWEDRGGGEEALEIGIPLQTQARLNGG